MTELKKEQTLRRFIQLMFGIYFLALLRLTLFKYAPLNDLGSAFFLRQRQISMIPFKAAIDIIQNMSPVRIVENLAGNVLLFMPFGLMFPLVSKFEGETTVFGMLLSLFIEAAQFILAMGYTDIDDLILNTLGAFLGYQLYRLINRLFKQRADMLMFMAIALGICCIGAVFVLYYTSYLIDGFPTVDF